jgi:hypothetical protein
MDIDDFFSEKKTTYTITDEHDDKSTITIDKWVADLLQEMLPDVHAWIQLKYDLVCEKKPSLSRREKGNVVRGFATVEARKSPGYKSLEDMLF